VPRPTILLTFALACLLLPACHAASAPGGPEATCTRACEADAKGCSPSQCARGCNLVLDRLAESEGGHVLACVAASTTACDDRVWSRCAIRVGPHADGGPPPPAPPRDVEDVTEGD
jgi:hypothetical protein